MEDWNDGILEYWRAETKVSNSLLSIMVDRNSAFQIVNRVNHGKKLPIIPLFQHSNLIDEKIKYHLTTLQNVKDKSSH